MISQQSYYTSYYKGSSFGALKYSYCANNPVGFVDPDGREAGSPDEWKYDPQSKSLTWVSSKGGETEQHVTANGKTKTIMSTSTESFVRNAKSHGITVTDKVGRGGFRFTNDNNTRQNNETVTDRDVRSVKVTDIITILDSWVGTLADAMSGLFGSKNSAPTPTPQNSTPEPELEPNGYTFEYDHPSTPNKKQYRYTETIDDSLKAVRDLKYHGLKIYKVTPSYKKK